jgi:hypothetical protein
LRVRFWATQLQLGLPLFGKSGIFDLQAMRLGGAVWPDADHSTVTTRTERNTRIGSLPRRRMPRTGILSPASPRGRPAPTGGGHHSEGIRAVDRRTQHARAEIDVAVRELDLGDGNRMRTDLQRP